MNAATLKKTVKKVKLARASALTLEGKREASAQGRRVAQLLKEVEVDAERAAAAGDDFEDVQIYADDGVPMDLQYSRAGAAVDFEPVQGSAIAAVCSRLKRLGFRVCPYGMYHSDYEDSYWTYYLRVEWR